MGFAICIIIAYLLGSISPSIIQGRLRGIDIKKEGSGNAGATNALRVLGKKAALITLCVDIAKGIIAVKIGTFAGPLCCYLCAVAVYAGHVWPVYFSFKGGKGVATAFGAVLAVDWRLALLCLAIVAAVIALTRYVSAGSICGAFALAIAAPFLCPGFWPMAAVIALVIILKHRTNIQRLLKGQESKLSFKGK